MLRKVIFIVFCLFFYCGNVWGADCEQDITADVSGTAYECNSNDTFKVSEGVTVSKNDNNYPINANNKDNITIDNYGTIRNNGTITDRGNRPIYLENSSNINIYNRSTGTISARKSGTIFLKNTDGDINIYNEGTISATHHGAIHNYADRVSGDIYIENSGIIRTTNTSVNNDHTGRHLGSIAILGDDSFTGALTINNTGTIDVVGSRALPAIRFSNAGDNTLTTSGTISGGPEQSSGGVNSAGMDIVIDKCSGDDNMDHCGGTKSGTTTINLTGGPTFSKGLDLNGTKVNIVLKEGLKRDVTIRIFDYVEESSDYLTITREGQDTYTLTAETLTYDDDSANVDGSTYNTRDATVVTFTGQSDSLTREEYNAGTDGILTIFGEDLEVEKNNQKYRAENTLTKLKSLFSASNYVGGKRPDYCTTIDPKKVDSELDVRCNKRFVKIFHSYQTREGVYDGTSSGILGMLSPIKWKDFPLVSNIFVGYSNQEGDFNNGEFLGGANYVLGFRNTYENKGFLASLTPMIGLNDLNVVDYDTDKVQTISNNFLSEFAAVNGKIIKEIVTGKDRSLNISVETTYGLQKFPDYISTFTDGDFSVDESIEELLSGGFEVSYLEGLPGGFIIKPYFGANKNKNLSDQTKITARGKNSNVSPIRETWSGYYAGVSLTKEAKGIDFDLNLMYGNEGGLISQIAAVSLTKAFGKAKKETISLEPVPDLPKVDESLTTQDYNKSFKELEMVRDLNKKLKIENEKLKAQNEKLKLLAKKTLEENEISKKMIIELIKENEKVKLENQIFKNRILENENKELIEQLEGSNAENKPSRILLLIFGITFVLGVLGSTKLITLSTASIYNRMIVSKNL